MKSKPSNIAPIVIVALFAMIAAAFIATGTMRGLGAKDDVRYHHIAIEGFISEWPWLDFSDYESATTPGYHAVVATGGQLTDARWWLRAVGALFTAGLLFTLARSLRHRMSAAAAIACSLPVLCSMYVLNAGVYLLPDNAGWLGVLGVMLIALRARFGFREILLSSLLLFALVWCRQIHIWTASMIWAAAWVSARTSGNTNSVLAGVPIDHVRDRASRMLTAMLACAPAFVVIGSFYVLWGSRLSPPQFGDLHTEGLSGSTPAFFLSLFGIASAFFAGWWLPSLRRAWNRSRGSVIGVVAAASVCGLLVSILPITTFSVDAGRFSGIWNAVRKFPVVADRSVLLAALSTFGAVMLGVQCLSLPSKPRVILLSGMLWFLMALSANPQVWQRYHEPFVLILVAVMASHAGGEPNKPERSLRLIGPLALAALLGALAAMKFLSSDVVAA